MRIWLLVLLAINLFSGCAAKTMPPANEPLVHVFPPAERKTTGAYFWDSLREDVPEWKELKYVWIASSQFGDQIIVTENSPLHTGTAVYMHGPDVAGPKSDNPAWIENIIYLGPSIETWLARVKRFKDEHSICPGSIDEELGPSAAEYRAIYRELNPGLQW